MKCAVRPLWLQLFSRFSTAVARQRESLANLQVDSVNAWVHSQDLACRRARRLRNVIEQVPRLDSRLCKRARTSRANRHMDDRSCSRCRRPVCRQSLHIRLRQRVECNVQKLGRLLDRQAILDNEAIWSAEDTGRSSCGRRRWETTRAVRVADLGWDDEDLAERDEVRVGDVVSLCDVA